MPVPAEPEGTADPLTAALALFGQLHQQLREVLSGLDDAGLGWAPVEGSNSIAVILTHLLGSEAESLGVLAGQGVSRDRDSEFVPRPVAREELIGLLDDSDLAIERLLASGASEVRLEERVSLPTLPDDRRPGITWLIANYGHAREHLGEIQLTQQLYLSRHHRQDGS